MHLSRVRNDHAADKGGNCLDYGVGIACCLDHEVILRRQLGSERRKVVTRHLYATQPDQAVAIDHHRLGEGAVNIHANNPHH